MIRLNAVKEILQGTRTDIPVELLKRPQANAVQFPCRQIQGLEKLFCFSVKHWEDLAGKMRARFAFCLVLIPPFVVSSTGVGKNGAVESITNQSSAPTASASEDIGLPQKQPRWSYPSSGMVRLVAISTDGRYISMGTNQGYVYLFNTSSNTALDNKYIKGPSVDALAISDNGAYLAAATGNLLMVYRARALISLPNAANS